MPRKGRPSTPSYRPIPDYYDPEYAELDMLQHDVPFLLDHLPKRSQRILEIGVGTGRAAIPLAQAGHRVVGVDYSRDILNLARHKRDSVGLGDRQLRLVQADVRKLKLPPADRFDYAVIMFNTFLAFATGQEQHRVLESIARHLRPRGRLWIDIFNPNLSLLSQDESLALEPTVFHVPALDRTVMRTTDVRRDSATEQFQHITFHYTWVDPLGQQHHERRDFHLTWMFPRELTLLLAHHGFEVERMYGNYYRAGVADDHPRLIALARRRAPGR